MSDLDKTPTPEERLRLLLSEAVEPVQPGPGAEARLQSKIRARRRDRDLPRRLRWAGATLGGAAVLVGVVVVATQTGRSDGSSASTAAGSTPTSTAPSNGERAPKAAAASAASQGSGIGSSGGQLATQGAGTKQSVDGKPAAPPPPVSLNPLSSVSGAAALTGDHSQDTLTLSGRNLTVKFGSSTQTVTLPQVSSGARVMGVTQLQDSAGVLTPVAVIRLGADSAHARDTMVAVVAGKLMVLRFGAEPVVLAVSASQGYTCAGSLLVTSTAATGYVVSGDEMIPTASTGVAKPGANCTFF